MTRIEGTRVIALIAALAMVIAACGGDDATSTQGTIQDEIVVVDPAQVQDAVDTAENGDTAAEVASAGSGETPDADGTGASTDSTDESTDDPGIEVAEAEEDELDGLLNSLNVFNSCIADRGYTLDGFPGDESGRTAEDFEPDYLAALGACAAESGIQDAAASFGASQANLTQEEIEQNNFGVPIFKECMEDLGWVVGELIPDARGALGFGPTGAELAPPDGGGFADFNTDEINVCRRTSEQYVADNFEADGA